MMAPKSSISSTIRLSRKTVCSPICIARSTCDGSYLWTDERHSARNNSKAPLAWHRSDSRTQNSFQFFPGFLSSMKRKITFLWDLGKRLTEMKSVALTIAVCVCACLILTMSWSVVWGSISVQRVTWGQSFHCSTNMSDHFHTVMRNMSGILLTNMYKNTCTFNFTILFIQLISNLLSHYLLSADDSC